MNNKAQIIPENYWTNFKIVDSDLEFLYNLLLELETPQTLQELLAALIEERIRQEKKNAKARINSGLPIYIPNKRYSIGDKLVFQSIEDSVGEVLSIRPGKNPELPPFDVLDIGFSSGKKRQFAAGVETHILNNPIQEVSDDPSLSYDFIINNYGQTLSRTLSDELESNPDVVRISNRWFPRALLVDVNMGYLNLAEALLDMQNGGPLPSKAILDQIEFPTDVNLKLTEFSLNHSLSEDPRFDDVGPAGEVLWFLHRLEPDGVQNTPYVLNPGKLPTVDQGALEIAATLEKHIIDEIDPLQLPVDDYLQTPPLQEIQLSLIYPHWRAGTIPLSKDTLPIFPTANESPRVRFTFIDELTRNSFSGWVVRPSKYVFGLSEWYLENGLIPGSLIFFRRGKNPGEVMIRANKRRATREWIRTTLIGTDGGMVFAMLKQNITADYDERMAISIPDVDGLEQLRVQQHKNRQELEEVTITMMKELAKLNAQGHVHASELYAAVNLVYRASPSHIIQTIMANSQVNNLGNSYFHLSDDRGEEND